MPAVALAEAEATSGACGEVGLGFHYRSIRAALAYEKLTPDEERDFQRFVRIKEKIQQRYEEAMDVPHNFEKIRRFARYWNENIPAHYLSTIRDAERPF